jgi:hypothetical protein
MTARGVNPFHYTSPVAAEDLVDRQRELSEILDLAYSGNNARLAAPRRYGKTSLLRAVLADADRRGFAVVYVDFFGVLTLDDIARRVEAAYVTALTGKLGQWFAAVRQTLKPTARLGGGPVPAQVEVTAAGNEEPLAQRLDLPLRLHERTGQRVLVAFDEFQDVLQAGQADAVIRSVIQHHSQAASYVFAGSHVGMMAELFGDRRRAFYAQAAPIPLPPLAPEDLGEFIGDRFRSTGKDVGDVLGALLGAADGHPQRAMLLAYALWNLTPIGQAADEEIWVAAYRQTVAVTLDEIRSLWTALPSNARRVITAVAENRGGLYSRSSGQPRGGSVAAAVRALTDLGEIIEDDRVVVGYRVVDPLFASWIRSGRMQ